MSSLRLHWQYQYELHQLLRQRLRSILLLIMGLRGGGESLNSAATNLNTDAHDVQMACAAAGTPA